LPSLDRALEILERAVRDSPADRTEISWAGADHHHEELGGKQARSEGRRDEGLTVRVVERGRAGSYRARDLEAGEIAAAIRQALAIARLAPPSDLPAAAAAPEIPGAPASLAEADLRDPDIESLTPVMAREIFRQGLEPGESARLDWIAGSVAFAATGEPSRSARSTGACLEIRAGKGPATGSAIAAARTLARLAPGDLLDRARERRADPDDLADAPAGACPILLAPAAVARLAATFARWTLASHAIEQGLSPLENRWGERLFSPLFSLRDDALDPAGLPFPFDQRGRAKRPVELIEGGVARTPALTDRLAASLRLPPTPLAISPDEAAAANLFVAVGDLGDGELLARAEGGLFLAALEPLEVYDRAGLRFRTVAHGVRRLEAGRDGAGFRAVLNLLWESDLFSVFTRLAGAGAERTALADGSLLFGGIVAPALLLEPAFVFRPA